MPSKEQRIAALQHIEENPARFSIWYNEDRRTRTVTCLLCKELKDVWHEHEGRGVYSSYTVKQRVRDFMTRHKCETHRERTEAEES